MVRAVSGPILPSRFSLLGREWAAGGPFSTVGASLGDIIVVFDARFGTTLV